ncbi:hypothetical protein SERLA73DRAFT_45009, partial [Serpula lacrymans var. lacrymans S7.3]
EIYTPLKAALILHSRLLRLNFLRILASSLVKASPGEQDIVKCCLQEGEKVSLDAHRVRECVLHIGRASQVVKDGDRLVVDLCARWLICAISSMHQPLLTLTQKL